MCWEGWRAVGLFIHQAPEVHVMAAQRQQAFPCRPGRGSARTVDG